MICARCETDNPPGAEYCLKCGARLVELPQASPSMNTWRLAIVDVVLVLAAIFWTILGNNGYYYQEEWHVANLGLSVLAAVAFLFSLAYAAYEGRKMMKVLQVVGIFLLAVSMLSYATLIAYNVLVH